MADADFNYPSGRVPEDLLPGLAAEQITGRSIDDTVDLLSYRQLHSPIFTLAPWQRQLPNLRRWETSWVASCLEPLPSVDGALPMFKHPSGYEVEARDDTMPVALAKLLPLWPQGLRADKLFPDVREIAEDLLLCTVMVLSNYVALIPMNFLFRGKHRLG